MATKLYCRETTCQGVFRQCLWLARSMEIMVRTNNFATGWSDENESERERTVRFGHVDPDPSELPETDTALSPCTGTGP